MPVFNTIYHLIRPEQTTDFKAQWDSCRQQLQMLTADQKQGIFKINVFLQSANPENFQHRRDYLKEEISNLFGESCPAFGIIPQPPDEPYALTIEAGIIHLNGSVISYRRYDDFPYVIIEREDTRILWANGLENYDFEGDTESRSINSFEIARELLQHAGMTFDHVVRQWNYIGSILHKEKDKNTLLQHYQVFNEVRSSYYNRYRTTGKYPAATGIGMNYEGVSIDLCAVMNSDKIKISSINNPIQIEPYRYDQEKLIGTGFKKQKSAPQFERAKILVNNHFSTIFISGTASIVGENTIAKGDVQKQTRVTIDNIRTLVSRENLLCHSLQSAELNRKQEFKYIRVYVKNQKDIPSVQKICIEEFGAIPANYVQADICRDDLLVEIEGEVCLRSI